MVLGVSYRFSDHIFGHGTVESMYMWFVGSTASYCLWTVLALKWSPRRFKKYIKAFCGISITWLVNDVFYAGKMNCIDEIAVVLAAVYIIYKLIILS